MFPPPSPELQALIRKESKEDPETREASLQTITDWLAKEPHLPDTWDEVPLLNFLRNCNFSLEKCKKKLDRFFTIRARVTEFFTDRDIKKPAMQEVTKVSCIAYLPILTPEGRRVALCRFKDKNSGHISLEELLRLFFMIEDVRLTRDKFGCTGDVYIFDAENITMALAAKLTPSLAKKYIACGLETYPVKMKEFHVVNAHPLMETVFKWVKVLLKDKLVQRFHFHSNGHESLHQFIPKYVLPEEYGGTAGKVQDLWDVWIKRLDDYTSWFKEQEKLVADDCKRPADLPNYDEIFGVDGSFRQLNVD